MTLHSPGLQSGGSYPATAVDSAPAAVVLSLPNVDTGLVWINAISTGDYRVRFAARNGDGVGPWSEEVGFTVSGATPRSQPDGVQSRPGACETSGSTGDEGMVARWQSQYAELNAQMREWRNHPQWSHQKAHTDRWDWVLLAFGERVADTTLSAMTAA